MLSESVSGNFLDSPATTSSTTYKIQTFSDNVIYVNRGSTDADNAGRGRGASIILMEILA
jgi:hypothetical protein